MESLCPEQSFGYLLREVSQLWRTLIDRRLEPLGLSDARWQPLLVLHRSDEPMTQTAIATALEIEAPSLVRLLDRLCKDGWVERHKNPHDRRAHHVTLTAKARRTCDNIEQALADTRNDVLAHIDEAEVCACVDVLTRVRTRAASLLNNGATPQENPITERLRRPRQH